MRITQLEWFIAVARHGSFAAAARAAAADPSLVSRAIGQLEGALGTQLFARTTRQLALTDAGQRYLARVEPLVDEWHAANDAARAASSTPAGRLRISASVAFGQERLVPLLDEFMQRYPALTVELDLTDRPVDLIASGTDLALRMADVADTSLVRARLVATRYRLVAAPSYLAREPRIAQPLDVRRHRTVRFDLPGFRDAWHFRRDGADTQAVPVDGALLTTSALAVRDAARRGLGLALLADWMLREDFADGQLVDVLPDWDVSAGNFATAIWLVYPSRRFLPHRVRVAIDFLREQLADARE
ncbi:MAG: LysR substrate-binding domain-containing protein [Pseudomonadota bacterium]